MIDESEKLIAYLNGTLEESERQALEASLKKDTELAGDAEFLAELRAGLKAEEVTPPGELGLARLKKDIQVYENAQQDQPLAGGEPVQGAAAGTRAWKPVGLAACALLVIQAGVLAFMLQPQFGSGTADIQPLAGESRVQGPVVQVVFSDQTSLQALQNLLQDLDGNIVQGPGRLGIYEIQLPEQADVKAVLSRLRGSPLVEQVSQR